MCVMSEEKPLHTDAVDKILTAHHPRTCAVCGGIIPVGARYARWHSYLDLKVRHECATCAASNDRPIPEAD